MSIWNRKLNSALFVSCYALTSPLLDDKSTLNLFPRTNGCAHFNGHDYVHGIYFLLERMSVVMSGAFIHEIASMTEQGMSLFHASFMAFECFITWGKCIPVIG